MSESAIGQSGAQQRPLHQTRPSGAASRRLGGLRDGFLKAAAPSEQPTALRDKALPVSPEINSSPEPDKKRRKSTKRKTRVAGRAPPPLWSRGLGRSAR
ncbi:hypothetical protein MHYP_G00347920 [Metynnis hypsauchen]